MPKPWQCTPYHHLLNQIQPYSHLDCNEENRQYHTPQSCRPSWKRSLSNFTNNENKTYTFIAYWTQRSILFCCTETNNILRAVLSNEDAVFSMRTFTWSWWLPVSLCRPAIGLDIEPYGLHAWRKINQHLPSKQTSARGGKVYSYSGFLNFFSTCSSAIRRLTSSSWSMS